MDKVATVWIILTLVLGVYAAMAAWSRGGRWFRALAVLSLLVAVPASGVSLAFSLGLPLPLVEGLTLSPGKHVLIAKKLELHRAIYLWVDAETPGYYWLPWSNKKAMELQDAQDKAGKDGQVGLEVRKFKWPWSKDDAKGQKGDASGGLMSRLSSALSALFEFSLDQRDPKPYPMPQPKMPDKEPPPPGHEYIQQPETHP